MIKSCKNLTKCIFVRYNSGMIIDDGSLLSISASDLDADGVLRVPDGVYEIAQNVGVRLWQSSYNMSAGIRPQGFFYLLDRHAPLAMTKVSKCIIPQSLCHSRLRGNDKGLSTQSQTLLPPRPVGAPLQWRGT